MKGWTATSDTGAVWRRTATRYTFPAGCASLASGAAESLLATARQQEQQTRSRFELGDVSRQEVLTSQLEAVSAEMAKSALDAAEIDSFLQSDDSAFTTGQTFLVDGGSAFH